MTTLHFTTFLRFFEIFKFFYEILQFYDKWQPWKELLGVKNKHIHWNKTDTDKIHQFNAVLFNSSKTLWC